MATYTPTSRNGDRTVTDRTVASDRPADWSATDRDRPRDPSISPSGINSAGVANSNKMPTHYTKEDVAWLVSELGKRDFGPEKIVIGEPYLFGLALDVFDPVSEHVITCARPARRDLAEELIFLVPDRVAAEVAGARTFRVNRDRALGIMAPLTEAEAAARKKALDEERAEADAKKAKALA